MMNNDSMAQDIHKIVKFHIQVERHLANRRANNLK